MLYHRSSLSDRTSASLAAALTAAKEGKPATASSFSSNTTANTPAPASAAALGARSSASAAAAKADDDDDDDVKLLAATLREQALLRAENERLKGMLAREDRS